MTGKYTDGTAFSDEFNTVVFAIGRDACTENIGLDKIGVKLNPQVLRVQKRDIALCIGHAGGEREGGIRKKSQKRGKGESEKTICTSINIVECRGVLI